LQKYESFNLYLKGTYHYQMFTAEGLKQASSCFEQSLEKDPNYALPYVGSGYVSWLSATWGNVQSDEAYPKAKEF